VHESSDVEVVDAAAAPGAGDERRAAWSRDYARVASAIAWLDQHQVVQPGVDELAAALHLSPSHLHRTFVRFAGVSPHRFLRWLTLGAAKDLLRERATVLETATATGLSSTGRLHDLTVTLEAVTPGEIGRGGAGLTIRHARHPTPLGDALVATTDRGVLALRFLDASASREPASGEPDADAVAALAMEWPAATLLRDPEATRGVADHLAAALRAPGVDGSATRGPLPVLAVGTNLQIKVWEALLSIPDDRVVTYAEVARAAGRPDAVRPVAGAVGRNPVAALIPCHRVLRSSGGLGGYRWGTTRKRALLAREAARADDVA